MGMILLLNKIFWKLSETKQLAGTAGKMITIKVSPYHGLTKSRRNKDTKTKNDFHHFIEDVYNNCKKYNIKPSDFIGFIKDLFNFYPSLECEFPSAIDKDPDRSLPTDSEDESDNIIYFR